MQIHELKRKNPNTQKVRIGRGGRRGKTSGRGHKGQSSRAGRKIRPEIRDMIKKIPKKRGHGKNRSNSYNSGNIKPQVVKVSVLEDKFGVGEIVNIQNLVSKKLVNRVGGKNPKVKVLGNGELKKKLSLEGLLTTKTAKEKIEKAGGAVK